MKTEYKSGAIPVETVSSHIAAHEYPTSVKDENVCRPLTSKICKGCRESKSIQDFYYNKTRGTYFAECKECNRKRSSDWNKNNPDQYKTNCKRHKLENPELYSNYKKKEYSKNKQKYRESGKKYRESTHGKGVRQALERERQLSKKNACPKWLSEEHREQMKQIYINRPEGYHVDHIVPLKGKIVSGLHVPWNLQYLTAAENSKKKNKF